MKKLQKEVEKINRKKLRFQPITAISKEETVGLMFSCCIFTFKVKLNIDWQIDILSKSIYMINEIAFIVALY